ncbi:SDR family NAD(P)-dependent oxidoreductase [Paenibacillus sp. PR3]|uniref:SDR family NAD(P)-dependent oxidoreductase n=1 Tax=Paenibacillus terricola TaxID=2763503 RepID=A0ABR8N1Z5_9BACL|nr:SDR family NAD(P)-dependent oxidoreductase [Paenibacillus terricola]MBD3921556.1 SDR family NAD(P)-dependent oxidoreductase [Paenibacillus terricola]
MQSSKDHWRLIRLKYFIVTGSSRGIGRALSEKLLSSDHHLLCISREVNHELVALAESKNAPIDYFPIDLINVHEIDALMKRIIGTIDESAIQSIYLVNNAAVVQPVEVSSGSEPNDIIAHMNINLVAPMLLTSSFIKYTEPFKVDKRIMNISSGLSFNLKPMLSCYSTSKAGLETFVKAIGVEQRDVRIMGVRPGATDTRMYEQSVITDKSAGTIKLASTSYAADRIITFLFDRFEHGKVVKGW